jgi:hypothetical protein
MSKMGPEETPTNSVIFETLRGQHKLLLNRHLPQITNWCVHA